MRHLVVLFGLLLAVLGCIEPVERPASAAPASSIEKKPAQEGEESSSSQPPSVLSGQPDLASPAPSPSVPPSQPDLAQKTKPEAPASGQPSVPPRPGLQTDIEYGRADGIRLLLDANVPEGVGPFPVVILVHGGGWTSGDKQQDLQPILGPLGGRFTWFSLNYRLAPKYRWPACLEDVQTAIRWVKANAPAYKGDPLRIAIAGYSAGGQIATLAANLAADGTGVNAVVGVAPVTDLVKDSERRGGLSKSLQTVMNLPKTLTESTRQILTQASPITYVKPGQAPVLLLCGDADKTVPLGMCQDYLAKLKEQGVPGELVTVQGGPHRLSEWEKSDPSYKNKLIDWLERALP